MSPTQKTKQKLKISAPKKEWDEVFQLISWWDAAKIRDTTIMVVGAGALGNEVLKNLALLNVGRILIVDFDYIEYANLSRSVLFREKHCGLKKVDVAAEQLKVLNPNVKVMTIHGDIIYDVGLGVINQMDVIIGCLDNRVARLYINRHAFKMGKTWVNGGIRNLSGQLEVYKPGQNCYECQLDAAEWEIIRMRESCTDTAERNANNGRIPTTPISASIIGAMQVQEALKVIFNNEAESLAGQQLNYYGRHIEILIHSSAVIQRINCESHSSYQDVLKSGLSHLDSVEVVLGKLRKLFSAEKILIHLDYDIVLEVTGSKSEVTTQVLIPKPQFSSEVIRRFEATPGEGLKFTQDTNIISDEFPHQQANLSSLGIPALQILTIETEKDILQIELDGDLDFLSFN